MRFAHGNWLGNRSGGGELVFEARYFPTAENYVLLLNQIFPSLSNFQLSQGIVTEYYHSLLEVESSVQQRISFTAAPITSLSLVFEMENTLSLMLVFPNENPFNASLIDRAIIQNGGFAYACYYEFDYMRWQNADRYESYKFKGGLHTYKMNAIRYVDLSDRPGRKEVLDGKIIFKFLGASTYWFGRNFNEYWEWEHLISFEGDTPALLHNTEIIRYDLYPIYEGDSPGAQNIQWRFRDFLKIDQLAANLHQKYQDQWALDQMMTQYQSDLKVYKSAKSVAFESGNWPRSWISVRSSNLEMVINSLDLKNVERVEASFDKGVLAVTYSEAFFAFRLDENHCCLFGFEQLLSDPDILASALWKNLVQSHKEVKLYIQGGGGLLYVSFQEGMLQRKLAINDYQQVENIGADTACDIEFIQSCNNARLQTGSPKDLASLLLMDDENLFRYFLYCTLQLKHYSLLKPIPAGILIWQKPTSKPWWKFW